MVNVMDKNQQQLLLEIEKLNKAQLRIKRKTTIMLAIIALLVLITATILSTVFRVSRISRWILQPVLTFVLIWLTMVLV